MFRFKNILAAGKDKVKTIVYMENPIHWTPTLGFREDVTIVSFWDVISRCGQGQHGFELGSGTY